MWNSVPVVGPAAAFFAIAVLPGAWLTFVPKLGGLAWPLRLALSAALSPLVVGAEFFALRWCGLDFATSVTWVVYANLPAVIAVLARMGRPSREQLGTAAIGVLAAAAPLLTVQWRRLVEHPTRLVLAHSWVHCDIIYDFAGGALRPEEAELPGTLAGYHWLGHLFQAHLSWVLDEAPSSSYAFTNAVAAGVIVLLVADLARRLGAGRWGVLASVPIVLLGLNSVTYWLELVLPGSLADGMKVTGAGWTYTPWIWKFQFFNQLTIGLAVFAAVLWMSVVGFWTGGRAKLALAVLAVVDLGFVYPVLLPAAGLSIASALAVQLVLSKTDGARPWRRFAGAAAAVAAGFALAWVNVHLIGEARTGGTVELSDESLILSKGYYLVLASLVFLPAAGALWRRLRERRGGEAVILTLAALGSAALFVPLSVGNLTAENKFLFSLAVCAAPLAGAGLGAWIEPRGRAAPWLFLTLLVLLMVPLVHKVHRYHAIGAPPDLVVDGSGFYLELPSDHPLFGVCAAIRERTPGDAIILADEIEVHLPTLTRRHTWAPPHPAELLPGVGLGGNFLLVNVRGKPKDVVGHRMQVRRDLFFGDDAARAAALAEVSELGRPVVVLLDRGRHADLARWLEGKGREVFEDERFRVVLVSG